MAITTYDELKSAIADWLQRDDLTAVIPTFIALAEVQLFRTVRHRRMISRATTTVDEEYEELPADFLEIISAKLDTSPPRVLTSIGILAMEDKKEGDETNTPEFYAIIGDNLTFYPRPSGSDTLEIIYYAKPDALSDDNASNALLEECPDLYLYGALLQAAPYLGDDGRIATWGALYQQRMTDLENADSASQVGATKLVTEIALSATNRRWMT